MSAVERALVDMAAGRPVVLVSGYGPQDQGDLVVAAQHADTSIMAFIIRYTSGYVCVAVPEDECGRLGLVRQCGTDDTAFADLRVAVDAVGVGTGISARSRSRTVQVLSDAAARPSDLVRPGHVIPIATKSGGALVRGERAEASADLARMAGLRPVSVMCEVVSPNDPTRMANAAELIEFARVHQLLVVSIPEIVDHRMAKELTIDSTVVTKLPASFGALQAICFRFTDGSEHVVMAPSNGLGRVGRIHVHRECLLGDVFGAAICSCRHDLDVALREIERGHLGAVLYLRRGPTIWAGSGCPCGADLDLRESVIAEAVVAELVERQAAARLLERSVPLRFVGDGVIAEAG